MIMTSPSPNIHPPRAAIRFSSIHTLKLRWKRFISSGNSSAMALHSIPPTILKDFPPRGKADSMLIGTLASIFRFPQRVLCISLIEQIYSMKQRFRPMSMISSQFLAPILPQHSALEPIEDQIGVFKI